MSASRSPIALRIYFSDVFQIAPEVLDNYGAFNVSLIRDLPLFVDPFLLFNSKKPQYRELHDEIIKYVRFLRDKTVAGPLDEGLIQSLFRFKEVKQNWLGFSAVGNGGTGLGPGFATALNLNLGSVFRSFGEEGITNGNHLEKLCLIDSGVGRDHVSDFVVNLIKRYLLEYTQTFALTQLRPEQRKPFPVSKVRFNYETESWVSDVYELPKNGDDFVVLTPKDILTKDEAWINRGDLLNRFDEICEAIPNDQLRAQVNNYFRRVLPRKPKAEEVDRAKTEVIRQFREIIEYYIKDREDHGDQATASSRAKVSEAEELLILQVVELASTLQSETDFYKASPNSYEECKRRLGLLKHVIEDKDGYRSFYQKGSPVHREDILRIMFQLTWCGTTFDVNREVNNGRGPADFVVSLGAADKTVVELKLATNPRLVHNLRKQAELYARAGDAQRTLKGVMYFSADELKKAQKAIKDAGLESSPDIVLLSIP